MAEKDNNKNEEIDEVEANKKAALRIGLGVLILLAAMTAGEYWIGSVAAAWWAPLIGIAIMKAFLVIRDYMHIGRLFATEEEAHE